MLRRTLIVALLAIVSVGAVWLLRRGRKDEPADPVYPDPRATFDTPFQNVRPEVQYVGSKACLDCHVDKAKPYSRHPMGRSFAPLREVADEDCYDATTHNPFQAFGNEFRIELQGPRVVHAVRRSATGGVALFERANEVGYVMGSGSHGRTYIVNRDGYLH